MGERAVLGLRLRERGEPLARLRRRDRGKKESREKGG
jgi:hypothetical protein